MAMAYRQLSLWPAAVLALAVVAVVWWTYRRTYPPLPAGYRIMLSALRTVVVLLLGLLVLEPVLALSGQRTRPERVALLIDHSASMLLPVSAEPGDTANRFGEALEMAGQYAASNDTTVKIFGFGRGLTALDSADALTLEDRTDLAGALESLLGGPGTGWDRVVVVSDGRVNAGGDPRTVLRSGQVTVDAVLVGREPSAGDIALVGIEELAPAYEDERVELELTLGSSGGADNDAVVDIFLDGRKVAERRIAVAGSGSVMSAAVVEFDSPEAGSYWLEAVVRPAGDEWTALNNRRLHRLHVRESRSTFLVVSNSPDWDVTFTARALASNEDWRVENYLVLPGGRARRYVSGEGFSDTRLPSAAGLNETALVVLHGDIAGFSGAFTSALADRAVGGGFGLVIWPAGPFNPASLPGGLTRILPVVSGTGTMTPVDAPQTPAKLFSTDRYGVLDALGGGGAIDGLPPLTTVYRGIQPQRSAEILARAGSRGPLAGEGPPVLLVRPSGGVRTALVAAQGLWRWHMQRQLGDPEDAAMYFRMWRELAGWLISAERKSPLVLGPERDVLGRGEPVRLSGEIRESSIDSAANVRVTLVREDSTGAPDTLAVRETVSDPDGNSFEVDFGVQPPGRYAYSAAAHAGGDTIRTTGVLAVEEYSPELADIQPDSVLLGSLSESTGGSAVRWDGNARPEAVTMLTETVTREASLARKSWIYWLLIGLLAAEWALRRRKALS